MSRFNQYLDLHPTRTANQSQIRPGTRILYWRGPTPDLLKPLPGIIVGRDKDSPGQWLILVHGPDRDDRGSASLAPMTPADGYFTLDPAG